MIIYEATIAYNKVGSISAASLDQPHLVEQYMKDAFLQHPLQEQVFVIMLNRKNIPMARERVSLGSATGTMVDPSIVFRPAILAGATAIILCHNHPSGDPAPSQADLTVTSKIVKAGEILSITVQDHVIIGDDRYYSFSEHGLL
jgi:DNA repair protein RadC